MHTNRGQSDLYQVDTIDRVNPIKLINKVHNPAVDWSES